MNTKIIATIGPASENKETIENLIKEGVEIFRMNFSHCTYEEYKTRRKIILEAAKKFKKKVKILQDLQGPRIRVGELPKSGKELKDGELVIFTTSQDKSKNFIFIDNPHLHTDISIGDPIYLANGEMELETIKTENTEIHAKVIRGGILYSRKGVNLPKTKLTISGLTDKDIEDVKFSIKEGVDYIGISFVQSKKDVEKLRSIVNKKVKIVSKIETALAVKNADEIIQESDAIMIARGDLGIEIPMEEIPYIQKNLIRHATWHGVPSIVATQMMMSMINHPHPTRAEISDIANAVLDGASVLMLSDETAQGKYPKETIQIMVKTIKHTEKTLKKELTI